MGDRAGAQTVGNWLPPVQFPTNYVGCSGSTEPVYAVHAHLIPVGVHRGKVLIWGRGVNAACWFQYLLTAPGDYDQQFAIVDADANPVTVTYGVWRIPAAAAPPLFGVSYTIPGPTPITVTNGVQGLFCAGHCWLPDGRLMVFGGTDWSAPITDPYAAFTGSRLVAIYDPRGPGLGSWSTVQQLQPTMPHLLEPRWYATAVVTVDTTAAGRVIKVVVLGGVEQVIEGAHPAGTPVNRIIAATDRAYLTHEAYDVEQGLGTDWTITKDIRQGGALPPNYNPNTPVDGLFIGPTSSPPVPPNFLRGWGLFYYSRAHYLSNGVFGGAPAYAGGITWAGSMPLWTTWIDHPVNPNLWSTPHPSLPISTDILEEATAVLLPASLLGGGEDRIALFGGQDGLDHNGNLLTEVFVLDAKQVSPFWSTSIIPALPEARKFTNSVLLPDSSVLITGAVGPAELFEEHVSEGRIGCSDPNDIH